MAAASGSVEPGGGAPGDIAEGSAKAPGAFRRWRRTRPFWGGLLLILSGLELFFIPLEEVIMRGAVGVVMHMGIGGVSGVLIGGVLTLCGLLLWFDPAHRTFYAVIGVLGGVLSFPATNFGGFFLGLLLGIIGGSMAFGWRELPSKDAAGDPGDPSGPPPPEEGAARAVGTPRTADGGPADRAAGEARREAGASEGGAAQAAAARARRPARPGGGPALLAVAVLAPMAFSPMLLAGPAEAAPAPAAASPGPCTLLILCSPGPAPSPTGPGSPGGPSSTPPPSGLPVIGPPGGLLPSAPGLLPPGLPIPSGSPLPGASSSAGNQKSPQVSGSPGLEAYTAPVVLSAGAVRVAGFAYQGVADLPVAGGGTVRMMKFTARSFTAFNGVRGDIGPGGQQTLLTTPSLALGGGVVLYAAKFSGDLLGVPVSLTPDNAESVLLGLLKSVTPVMPLTMTNVSADQPVMVANSLQGRLTMSAV